MTTVADRHPHLDRLVLAELRKQVADPECSADHLARNKRGRKLVNRTRRSSEVITSGGSLFDPLAPRPQLMNVDDIAHALSNLCRFNGHVSSFYSVAQHSVLVSLGAGAAARAGGDLSPREVNNVEVWGLLHDATEAYLGDLIWPLKTQPSFRHYRIAEAQLAEAVRVRFGNFRVSAKLSNGRSPHDYVDDADKAVLMAEARDLFDADPTWAYERVDPDGDMPPFPRDYAIKPLPPGESFFLFMERYIALTQSPATVLPEAK